MPHPSSPASKRAAAWRNGLIGVIIFSGSLPATRVAVADFTPVFLTFSRASIAGVIAVALLLLAREKRPSPRQFVPFMVVATGVVIGFPLLTALALQNVTAAHSIVFIGMLPLMTAIFGVIRGGERPRPLFWLFAALGSLLVIGYAIAQDLSASLVSDLLMLLAVVLCGFAYAEGAKLSQSVGSWQVICWALVLSLPLVIPSAYFCRPSSFAAIRTEAWVGLGYVSLFSMLIGFFFWYRGLAQGGTAAVGQIQLLQPFLGLLMAALLLEETVSWGMAGISAGVIFCVAGSRKFSS